MKKFIVLSALVAVASTAFVACSSDDDLAQQPKAPETTVTNCPFNFIVGMDNGTYTRGTESDMIVTEDMDITRASVVSLNPFSTPGAGFNLYGFHGSDMMWTGAKAYSFDGDNWSGAGTWPSTSGACYFYALSYAGSNTPSGNVKDEPDGDSYDAVSFTYELPNSAGALTLASQEDLLVAENMNGISSGNVALTFSHALSNIGIKFLLPTEVYSNNNSGQYQASNISRYQFFYLKTITIHNLPTSGTYTYGAENPWTSLSTKADVVINFGSDGNGIVLGPKSLADNKPAGAPTTGLDSWFGVDEHITRLAYEHSQYTDLSDLSTSDNSIMIIPHKATVVASSFSGNTDDIFIEIDGFLGSVPTNAEFSTLNDENLTIIKGAIAASIDTQGKWVDDAEDTWDAYVASQGKSAMKIQSAMCGPVPGQSYCGEWDDNAGTDGDYVKVSTYLKFTAGTDGKMTFSPNKKYTLYLNLNNLLKNSGESALEGI